MNIREKNNEFFEIRNILEYQKKGRKTSFFLLLLNEHLTFHIFSMTTSSLFSWNIQYAIKNIEISKKL